MAMAWCAKRGKVQEARRKESLGKGEGGNERREARKGGRESGAWAETKQAAEGEGEKKDEKERENNGEQKGKKGREKEGK